MIAPDSEYVELWGFQKETGMEPRAIPSSFTTTFAFDYRIILADMRRLSESVKRDQWNAARDIAWRPLRSQRPRSLSHGDYLGLITVGSCPAVWIVDSPAGQPCIET